VEVAERLREPLGRARSKPVFVECNCDRAPRTCGISRHPRRYDLHRRGIIGGPPIASTQDPAKGPRFYASGARAHFCSRRVAGLFGFDIAILDGPVGAASGLKLSYAGLTKGFTALCATDAPALRNAKDLPMLCVPSRAQSAEFPRADGPCGPDMRPKAYRWVAEMQQIAEFVGDAENGATIYEGRSPALSTNRVVILTV